MLKSSAFFCALIAIVFSLSSFAQSIDNGDLAVELKEYQQEYKTSRGRTSLDSIKKMEVRLFDIFSDFDLPSLEQLNGETLDELFNSLNVLSFYSAKKEHALLLQTVYKELEDRNLETPFHLQQLYGSLIQARLFEQARKLGSLADHHPGQPLPATQSIEDRYGSPTLWKITEQGIVESAVDLRQTGTEIVVVAHPLCAFSVKAMESIEANKKLLRHFKDSYWITPPDRRLGLKEIIAWNQKATITQLSLIGDRWDWPLPDTGTTPSFYIFRDGQLDQIFQGWPSQDMERKLLEALTADSN